MNDVTRMTPLELRGSLSLAMVFFLRMLGLFLVLPVFVLYAEHLPGATPMLLGIALGCYGLTQALFQVPFGMLSDRIGRKLVITAGLLLFIAGSIIAAKADSIYVIILGRALQGAGAIAAAIMALAADLTRDNQRSKSMALIGISVGIAFMLAFVAGPALNPLIGVPGLFYLSAGLALAAIVILYSWVPAQASALVHKTHQPMMIDLLHVTTDKKLLGFNLSIFLLHTLLVASFIAIPLTLRDSTAIDPAHHWYVYLPVLLVSGLLMLPFLIYGARHDKEKLFLGGAVLLMALAQFGLFRWHASLAPVVIMLTLFFLSFNYLEATLPALISKAAPAARKGAALGVYSTSQFIGAFAGGVGGGHIYDRFGVNGIFLFGGTICIVWLGALLVLRNPIQHNRL